MKNRLKIGGPTELQGNIKQQMTRTQIPIQGINMGKQNNTDVKHILKDISSNGNG